MKFTPARLAELDGRFRFIKQPELDRPAAQRDPKVIETVSTMLSSIEKGGIDAVRRYAADLDGYDAPDFLVSAADLAAAGESLPTELRTALELGSERTKPLLAKAGRIWSISRSSWRRGSSPGSDTYRSPGSRLRSGGPIPVAGRRLHDRRGGQGRRRADRRGLHPTTS